MKKIMLLVIEETTVTLQKVKEGETNQMCCDHFVSGGHTNTHIICKNCNTLWIKGYFVPQPTKSDATPD